MVWRRIGASVEGVAEANGHTAPDDRRVDAPIVDARDIHKAYELGAVRVEALRGLSLTVAARRDGRDHGPERLREDNPAQLPLRPRCDRLGRGPGRGGLALEHARPPPHRPSRPAHGLRLPVLQPDAGADRGRERRAAAAGRAGARRRSARAGVAMRSSWSARPTAPATCPTSSRAASASGSTIARALVNEPAIVWADEPTGDLDSENAAEIVALMRRLNRERGTTFVIVTHDIAVGRDTDRIVRMLDGADRRGPRSRGGAACTRGSPRLRSTPCGSASTKRWRATARSSCRACASRRATRACSSSPRRKGKGS